MNAVDAKSVRTSPRCVIIVPAMAVEKEKCVGGRARSFKGDDLTFDEYKSILLKTHMNLPFSDPSLDTIFEKKMLNGYTLDLGFHVIGGEVQTYLQRIWLNKAYAGSIAPEDTSKKAIELNPKKDNAYFELGRD